MKTVSTYTLSAALFLCAVAASCALLQPVTGPSALRTAFPSATSVKQADLPPGSSVAGPLHVARRNGDVLGYAVREQVEGRSGPFHVLVVASPDLTVDAVHVVDYPYKHGRGVLKDSFQEQFRGMGPGDPVSVGTDVDAVTGATISSRATARGVRNVLSALRSSYSPAP